MSFNGFKSLVYVVDYSNIGKQLLSKSNSNNLTTTLKNSSTINSNNNQKVELNKIQKTHFITLWAKMLNSSLNPRSKDTLESMSGTRTQPDQT